MMKSCCISKCPGLTSSVVPKASCGLSVAQVVATMLMAIPTILATPPYGDPDQPYDRLPGTLETPHVKWAKPLAGGQLNVLFILPYNNSR